MPVTWQGCSILQLMDFHYSEEIVSAFQGYAIIKGKYTVIARSDYLQAADSTGNLVVKSHTVYAPAAKDVISGISDVYRMLSI